MQGTFYTSGIGNVSGMDHAHVPLWITYVGDRCWQLSWGAMGILEVTSSDAGHDRGAL